MNRRIEVAVTAAAARTDPDAIERGRYLYRSRGCMDCHGEDGAGKVVIDDGNGLLIQGPGITGAPGSVVAAYSDLDWSRTIRHGIKPDGRPVLIMPSEPRPWMSR